LFYFLFLFSLIVSFFSIHVVIGLSTFVRWIRSTINMSQNNEHVSHSAVTAAIQRAESPCDFPDPEGKLVKTFDKSVGIAEKDASGNRDTSIDGGFMKPTYDHTRRKLKPRHLQLIGIGGTIGTALYVQIGNNLRTSGPGSLFLGFSLW
jgi:amino acid transporter